MKYIGNVNINLKKTNEVSNMKLSQILLRKQNITTIDYDIMTTGTADGDEREPSCRQLLVIEEENKMSAFVFLHAEQPLVLGS